MAGKTTHPDGTEAKMGDGEEEVHACPSCGRHVEVACEITVSYTALPVVTVDELLAQPGEAKS